MSQRFTIVYDSQGFETLVQFSQVNIQIDKTNDLYSLNSPSLRAMDPTHKSHGFETYYQVIYINMTCN